MHEHLHCFAAGVIGYHLYPRMVATKSPRVRGISGGWDLDRQCRARPLKLKMMRSCNVLAYLSLAMTGAGGFGVGGLAPRTGDIQRIERGGVSNCMLATDIPLASASNKRRCSADEGRHRMGISSGPTSRGDFAKGFAGGVTLGLAAIFSPALTQPATAIAQSLEEVTADIMIAKEVFKPTLQYLKAEQFDAARTNTNYITRFLSIKKNIDALIVMASDVVDDPDVLEKAIDYAQEAEALFTNFDASVYTIIFIPTDADGVLPPGAEKYLKQAYGFYDDIIRLLDFYVNLVPADARKNATKLVMAKRASLPKFLFKEDSLIMKERVATS